MMMTNFLAVFIGGGFGAILRYGVSLMMSLVTTRIWLGTIMVNVIGSLAILFLAKFSPGSDVMKIFLKVGLLGGLTTFSSFSLEVFTLYSQGLLLESVLVVVLNIVFGIVVGIWIFA